MAHSKYLCILNKACTTINSSQQSKIDVKYLHQLIAFVTFKLFWIYNCIYNQQPQFVFWTHILDSRTSMSSKEQNKTERDLAASRFFVSLSEQTCFDLRMLITSLAPASPKTRSCSSCPMSRSPYSLINLLILPAI